jgi:hypothetical protein
MADAHALGACGETLGGSSPLPPIKNSNVERANNAAVIQLVECHLAKVDVKGSSPFRRSKFNSREGARSQVERHWSERDWPASDEV